MHEQHSLLVLASETAEWSGGHASVISGAALQTSFFPTSSTHDKRTTSTVRTRPMGLSNHLIEGDVAWSNE